MGCAHNKHQTGFTLVEISIVMIIIGLLIGGTFGGMKLIENMQVNKTVQDLKSIESAALLSRLHLRANREEVVEVDEQAAQRADDRQDQRGLLGHAARLERGVAVLLHVEDAVDAERKRRDEPDGGESS